MLRRTGLPTRAVAFWLPAVEEPELGLTRTMIRAPVASLRPAAASAAAYLRRPRASDDVFSERYMGRLHSLMKKKLRTFGVPSFRLKSGYLRF